MKTDGKKVSLKAERSTKQLFQLHIREKNKQTNKTTHENPGSGSESESHSVMSNSLQSHGLYSPWNSPGQNTGVGSLFLLLGIFPIQGSNPHLPHCRWILYLQAVVITIKMVQWMVKGQLHEKVKLLEKVNTLW